MPSDERSWSMQTAVVFDSSKCCARVWRLRPNSALVHLSQPRHSKVAAGFNATSANSSNGATWPVKASCAMSRPLPSNCGKAMDTTVGCSHPGSGTAGDQQPALIVRQMNPVRHQVGKHRTSLLRRTLLAERRSHAGAGQQHDVPLACRSCCTPQQIDAVAAPERVLHQI